MTGRAHTQERTQENNEKAADRSVLELIHVPTTLTRSERLGHLRVLSGAVVCAILRGPEFRLEKRDGMQS
jgi:hypothetical protein